MALDISSDKERKRTKRKLLGLCGLETVKSIRDIAFAMMPLDYRGYIFDMENEVRKVISLGRLYYRGDKFLFFTRIAGDSSTERYRIKLENADADWGPH